MRSFLSILSIILTVALAASCAKGGDELRQRVEQKLRGEPVDELVVSVNRHAVSLGGVVATVEERKRVEDLVRSVDGVFSVEDHIVVQQPPTLTAATPDDEEAAAISSALMAAGFDKVQVQVNGGDVRLVGSVPRARHSELVRIVQDAAPRAKLDEHQITLE